MNNIFKFEEMFRKLDFYRPCKSYYIKTSKIKLNRVKKMDSSLWLPIVLTIGALITGIGSWIQFANEKKNKEETIRTELLADSLAKENTFVFLDHTCCEL